MSDYHEAVREYEEMRAGYEANRVVVWPDLLVRADAAIAALEAEVERQHERWCAANARAETAEYAAKENREAMNNAVAAWRKAESALAASANPVPDLHETPASEPGRQPAS